MAETRYNVYVVREADDVAVAVIGKSLNGSAADRRFETGIERINTEEYWVETEKAGSEKDLKYAKDVEDKKNSKTGM